METIKLVKKAQKGDKEALMTLILNRKIELYKLAYVYMKNPDDAQDCLEDMIVIVYEKVTTLRKRSAFYSWCKQILVNCCKKKLMEKDKIFYGDFTNDSNDGGIGQSDDQMTLDYYLNQLSEDHRDVVRMKYILDYDLKTISGILDIPLGTVKSRLSIAMAKLKEMGGAYESN